MCPRGDAVPALLPALPGLEIVFFSFFVCKREREGECLCVVSRGVSVRGAVVGAWWGEGDLLVSYGPHASQVQDALPRRCGSRFSPSSLGMWAEQTSLSGMDTFYARILQCTDDWLSNLESKGPVHHVGK